MKEFAKRFGSLLAKDAKNNLGMIAFFGGTLLAITGVDNMTSGEYRFNKATSGCEKVLTQVDPPVYKLKTPSEICLKLDQGVSSRELIAGLEEQAQRDRPWGILKLVVGGAAAATTVVIALSPMITGRNRRSSLESSQ